MKPDGLVRIENVRGRIEVQGSDRSEVSVIGTLDDQTTKFIFETSGSTTTVKVETANNLNHGKGSDLVIRVPTGSRVRVGLVSADLFLKNLHGGIDAETVSGDIDAGDLSGRIEIQTVSGDIDVAGADGPVTLALGQRRHRRRHESRRNATRAPFRGMRAVSSGKRVKDASFTTVSGDVEISADLADGARVRGSSTSGDVRLRVNRDAGAVVELSAGSGSIKNELTSDRAERSMASGEDLEFTMGNGAGSIELTTVSGKLELLAR